MFFVCDYALTLGESRRYIQDGYGVFILVDLSGWNFSAENLTKEAIANQWAPPEVISWSIF
jgi:hypothetical protein